MQQLGDCTTASLLGFAPVENTDCFCVMLPCVATTPLLSLAASYLVGLRHLVTRKGFLNFEGSTYDEGKFATCGFQKGNLDTKAITLSLLKAQSVRFSSI